MKQVKKISKRITKSTKQAVSMHEAIVQSQRDFLNALLIVSVTANLFIVCLWVAVNVTSHYDAALVDFFFHR